MKILNFGSLNLDHVYQVPHFVSAGETLSSLGYQVHLGGKGFNQSVALSNAGARVYHAGCVGADGAVCKAYLEAHDVNTAYISTLDTPTGHAVIQVEESGQNCILLYGGANQCVTPTHIDGVLSHFGGGDHILLQNEISNVAYLIAQAKKRGMTVVLNPSPISEGLLRLPFSDVDWLLLNEVEGAALCGCANTKKMPALLQSRFPACSIVLTLGEAGAVCRRAGEEWAVPACRVKAVDTTAAGDTFTGYFLCGLMEGLSIPEAMRLASAAAAIAVTQRGAADSIPSRPAVQAMLCAK